MTDDDARTGDEQPTPNVRGKHYDWEAIRTTYVEGHEVDGKLTWPTLDDTAEIHSARPERVRAKSGEEGWVELRARFQQRVAEQRQTERSAELARLGADFDVAALRTARAGLALTASRLNELGAHQQARDRLVAFDDDHDGLILGDDEQAQRRELLERASFPVDANDLSRIALAGQRWFALGREALGDDTSFGVHVAPIKVEHTLTDERGSTMTAEIILALVEAGELDPGVAQALGLDPERPALEAAAFIDAADDDADEADVRHDSETDGLHSA